MTSEAVEWSGRASAVSFARVLLKEPGSVIELRALRVGNVRTVSGYFDDAEKLVAAAAELDGRAEGVYATLNPVLPALLARASNRLVYGAKHTTSDNEVVARRQLLIDADPVRPSGISSMDSEKQAALELITEVAAYLTNLGWPEPVRGDSGNGYHAVYAINLLAQDEGLVQRVLQALACRFDTDAVRIDQTVFNPARISKLYGTLARKGDTTPERPHRRSELLHVPDPIVPVGRELLERLAEHAPIVLTTSGSSESRPRFDVEGYLASHRLEVESSGSWQQGGHRWILGRCPFNPEHTDRSAFVVQLPSGAIAAGCKHNSCAGKRWQDLRDMVEPGRRSPGPFRPTGQDEQPGPEDDPGLRAGNGHVQPSALPALPAPVPPELQRYAQGALRRSVARVATASEHQRNDTLNKAAYNLGRFVGAGLLERAEVEEKLLTAAMAVVLPEREARDTIASGLGAGIAKPIDVQALLRKTQERNERRRPPAPENAPNEAEESSPDKQARLEIFVAGGKLPQAVDMAEAVLLSRGIYQRGTILVRTHRIEADSAPTEAIRRPKGALVIRPIDAPYLVDVLTRHADFFKFDKRSEDWVRIDCPEKVAVTYMARAGEWRVPVLRGVIEAPTIRPNGSVLSTDGYDRDTGLLFDSGGVVFGPFLARSTIDDARRALFELLILLKDFSFDASCDRAVVLAAILTTLIRRLIRSSPLFAFRAPVMGSGKSLLADIIALIATGRDACMMAQGKDEDETRKRVLAILIQGDAVACIDNVTHTLESAALSTVLTQEWYQDRLLGFSQMVRVPTSMTWLATGNNMVFEGDMITRVLPCDLEPGCEHPEGRKFDVDLRRYVPENRARLVTSALNVMLAYRHAGCPDQGLPVFGRYEEWSKWVRSALVWCGEADPCEGRARLESADPVTRRLRAVLHPWFARFGTTPVTAAQAITQASPELLHALLEVSPGRGGQPDARALGNWLHGHQRRIDLGLRLERAGERSGSALWMVSRAAAVGPVGPGGPPNPTREKTQAIPNTLGETLPQIPQVPRPDGDLGADEGEL